MFKKKGNCSTIKDVIKRNHPDINDFLFPEKEPEIKNLREAADYLKKLTTEDPECLVTIVGDYDVDGIHAVTIMVKMLYAYGLVPSVRIPHRISEGYGLSEKIIDEIPSGLVITVDNGIAAIDAIKKAKEKGLHVIIIDHHLPVKENGQIVLPDADIIIDPWIYGNGYYTGYSG